MCVCDIPPARTPSTLFTLRTYRLVVCVNLLEYLETMTTQWIIFSFAFHFQKTGSFRMHFHWVVMVSHKDSRRGEYSKGGFHWMLLLRPCLQFPICTFEPTVTPTLQGLGKGPCLHLLHGWADYLLLRNLEDAVIKFTVIDTFNKVCWNWRSSLLARCQTPWSLHYCPLYQPIPGPSDEMDDWTEGGVLLICASPVCLGLVSTLGMGGAIQRGYATEACAFGSCFRWKEGLCLANWKQYQHCILDLIDSAPELEIVFVTMAGIRIQSSTATRVYQ